MENYLLNYHSITHLTVKELIQELTQIEGLPMKECKVSDLVFYNKSPIYSSNGVYVFKTKEEFIYVGDCVARNFVERIPAHFDIREVGWFNSMLKSIAKKQLNIHHSNENLTNIASTAFDSLNLVLINFSNEHYDAVKIGKLETLLRMVLNPLNTFKGKRHENLEIRIADYLG